MVHNNVHDDGFRLLRRVHLLHHLHYYPQLLAHQHVRRCHYKHIFVHSGGDKKERVWCWNVSLYCDVRNEVFFSG